MLWVALSVWLIALLAPATNPDATAAPDSTARHAPSGSVPESPRIQSWPERTEELIHELHDGQEEDEDLRADPVLAVRLHRQARAVGRLAAAGADLGPRRLRPPGD